jgi:sugar-specific transcriptional regulator TrmB
MNEPEPVGQLVRLGLTAYEAKAYWGLVRRQSSSAAELARIAGVPRQRIYDVLDKLVERGLASVRPGRTVHYAAADPDAAIGRLLTEHRRRLAHAETEAGELIDVLRPAFEEGRGHRDPLDYIEVLREPAAIAERFGELNRTAKHEMLTFTRPPYVVSAADNVEGLAAASRVAFRTIYELAAFDDPDFVAAIVRFMEAGEEVRFVPEVPLKLAVMDGRTVMFAMDDPVAGGAEVTTIVVEHPKLAAVLKLAFERFWADGLSFEQAAARHESGRR